MMSNLMRAGPTGVMAQQTTSPGGTKPEAGYIKIFRRRRGQPGTTSGVIFPIWLSLRVFFFFRGLSLGESTGRLLSAVLRPLQLRLTKAVHSTSPTRVRSALALPYLKPELPLTRWQAGTSRARDGGNALSANGVVPWPPMTIKN